MAPSIEQKVIEEKLKEIARLVEEREQIQTRITKIEAAIRAFIELLEDEIEQRIYTHKLAAASKPLGITNAVKHVLLATGKKLLAPTDVRDELQKAGFPLSGYSNALAVIYTTLNRLCDQEFAEKIEGEFRLKAQHTPNEALAALGGLARQVKKEDFDVIMKGIKGLSSIGKDSKK